MALKRAMYHKEVGVVRKLFELYVAPIGLGMGAAALRSIFDPILHSRQPYIFFYIAVTICAIYYGIGSALVCLAFSIVTSIYLYLSIDGTIYVPLPSLFALFAYVFSSVVIAILAYRERESKDRARESAEEVKLLNAELEERVEERTRELKETNDELNGFTHSIAHDMRQYLRGINIASKGIEADLEGHESEEIRSDVESLGRNARQAMLLVDGLLEFAQLGKDRPAVRQVDLTAICTDITERISRFDRGVQPEFKIEPHLIVDADGRMLQLALENLIGNSVKYRSKDRKPVIEIGAAHGTPGRKVFYVKDNGIGFSMDYAETIFGAFERLHRASDYPGTGIGLANVKRIIEKHGGEVWVESAKGVGSTFYFSLPDSAEQVQELPRAA